MGRRLAGGKLHWTRVRRHNGDLLSLPELSLNVVFALGFVALCATPFQREEAQ